MIKLQNAILRTTSKMEADACKEAIVAEPPYTLDVHGHRGFVVRVVEKTDAVFTFWEIELLHDGPQYCTCRRVDSPVRAEEPGFLAKAQAHVDQFPSDDHYTIRKWNIVVWLAAAVVEALVMIATAVNKLANIQEEKR